MVKIMTIGANIKKLRLAKDMTQLQLATAAGITKSYVSLIESNDKIPSVPALYTIANVFGVSIMKLFEE